MPSQTAFVVLLTKNSNSTRLSHGNLAIFAAIRRASVSNLAADLRPGSFSEWRCDY
jgi:hypothetical protein